MPIELDKQILKERADEWEEKIGAIGNVFNAATLMQTGTIAYTGTASNTITFTDGGYGLASAAMTMQDIVVQYGMVRKRNNAIQVLFSKKTEKRPLLYVSNNTTSGNYGIGGNQRRIPDMSDQIEEMVFTVENDNLAVNVVMEGGRPLTFIVNEAWNPPLFAGNIFDGQLPQDDQTEIKHYNSIEHSREIMLSHIDMFGATGIDRAEFERDIFALYKAFSRRPVPEWLENTSLREKLLYMTSPFLREIGSEAVLYNAFGSSYDELNWTHQDFRYSFKELCKRKIGTDSPGTLKAVWDVILKGEEFRAYSYQSNAQFSTEDARQFLELNTQGRMKYTSEKGSVWLGRRKIEWNMFEVLGAIYEAFGVDHVRNFCLALKEKIEEKPKTTDIMPDPFALACGSGMNKQSMIRILKTMTAFCSPQKLLKGIINGDMMWLRDAIKMYSEYSSADKIPQKIRASYPTGIEIPKSWSTFKEFHDKISKAYTHIAEEAKERPFPRVVPRLLHRPRWSDGGRTPGAHRSGE